MIVVYAGRRPSPDGFPEGNVDSVERRLEQLMSGLLPRLVVGSAAAGADLLALKAGLRVDADAHVVLAGNQAEFRESSVADVGPDWARRYDALLENERVETDVSPLVAGDSEETYRAATKRIWESALAAKEPGEEIVVVPIAKERKDAVDHTQELVERQELAKGVVVRIDPTIHERDLRSAFVAMPFGTKPYLERNWPEYQADLTYMRMLLPALLDAGYLPARADTEALLEVIDIKMLRAINQSEVLVADLATANPNVMWELGVRHAWKRRGTILLALKGTNIPFDVKRVPVFRYERDEQEVSDADCAEGISLVQKVLAEVERVETDSPVFANLGTLQEVDLPAAPRGDEESITHGATRLLQDVTLAADLGHDKRLLELSGEVRSAGDLDDELREPLLEQIAFALIGLRKHDEAAQLLEPLAEADPKLSRPRLHEQYAHSLIRGEAAEGREQRLMKAETELEKLMKRQPATGETWGLLGSAAKARVELAVAAGEDPRESLDKAVHAYREGFRSDPGAYYPGINALALLRLRGQRLSPNADDLEEAERLLPVVRFAVDRMGDEAVAKDRWATLTRAECLLHERLLHGREDASTEAREWYARGAEGSRADQRASARRQLELFRNAGDPPELIDPLLELFSA